MIPIGLNRFIVEVNEILTPNKIELRGREFYLNNKPTKIFNYPVHIQTLESSYKIDLSKNVVLNFHGLSYILFMQLCRKVYLLENEDDYKLLKFNKWLRRILSMEK